MSAALATAGRGQVRRPPEGRDCRTEPLRALEVDNEMIFRLLHRISAISGAAPSARTGTLMLR